MSSRKKSTQKRTNPVYFVFCEGATEKIYIDSLRTQYRNTSIELESKVAHLKINQRQINEYFKHNEKIKGDKVFLFYDIGEQNTLNKLKAINDATLLVSNPCIELWFLLHFEEQTANTNCSDCEKKLKKKWKSYKKGCLISKHKADLINHQLEAIVRSKKLKPLSNPSSTVAELIKFLEDASDYKKNTLLLAS